MSLLTAQSNFEFSAARRRAFIEEWLTHFTGRSNNLLSFEEVKKNLNLHDSAYKGLQEIELAKIIGSTGRYRDFTRTFLPKTDRDESRWRQINAVANSGTGFPPIEVFKVGDVYFVRDGNHRVSVARLAGAKTIEAYVIEYKTSVPLDPSDDMDAILLKVEQAEFFADTRLNEVRPGQNVFFTEPGRYRLVNEHIAFHKYLKEVECGCEIPYLEAVASWYDSVYVPVIQLIRERGVLKDFPGRTEADLYAWLILHRANLEEELKALGHVPAEDIITELPAQHSPNPLVRWISLAQQKLRRQHISLKVERAKFLEETHLDRLRPDHNLIFTRLGHYSLTKEHIAVHKHLKELEQSQELQDDDAVVSWYDTVYLPLIQVIRERDMLKHFPGCTEADLYVWLTLRRAALENEMGELGRISDEEIIKNLEKERSSRPMARLSRFLRYPLRASSSQPQA